MDEGIHWDPDREGRGIQILDELVPVMVTHIWRTKGLHHQKVSWSIHIDRFVALTNYSKNRWQ